MKKFVRYSRIENIEDVIKEFSNKSSYGNVNLATFYKISVYWDSIVGATLIKVCKPIYYDGRILRIIVADSAWANEIMFHKSSMLKKIEDILKVRVKNIVTKIGDVESYKINEDINSIDRLLEQKCLNEQEQCWVDNRTSHIENEELRKKFESVLSTYVKTGGDIEQV